MFNENYSLADIAAILQAYQLLDKPYSVIGDQPVHVYYRVVPAHSTIDLMQDTREYLAALLAQHTLPVAERRVAFIGENTQGRFGVIARFKLNHQRLTDSFKYRAKKLVCTNDHEWIALNLYRDIELDFLGSTHQLSSIHSTLNQIPEWLKSILVVKKIPIFENYHYDGVIFTDTVLQQLFEGNIQPFIPIINAIQEHKMALALQLDVSFQKANDQITNKKILSLLSNLQKYQLLYQRCVLLAHIPLLDIVSQQYQQYWQEITVTHDDNLIIILLGLPIKILRFLVHHHTEVNLVCLTLQEEIEAQLQAITLWETQRHITTILPVSWHKWCVNHGGRLKQYLWQRNQAAVFQCIGRFIFSEMTEEFSELPILSRITQHVFNIIVRFTALMSRCLPAHLQPPLPTPSQWSDAERNGEFGAMLGALLGAFLVYYGGLFELLFSYTLLFVTELMHDYTKRTTRVQCYSLSLQNLSRINMVLVLTLIAIYIQDSYYFKRGLSAVALSEIVRRLFLHLSREVNLSSQEQAAFSFLFTSVGASIGAFLYGVYYDITAQQWACETAMQQLTHLIATEPGITYSHVESHCWFHPISFSAACVGDIRWGTNQTTYHAECNVTHDFSSTSTILHCSPPTALPRMITAKP